MSHKSLKGINRHRNIGKKVSGLDRDYQLESQYVLAEVILVSPQGDTRRAQVTLAPRISIDNAVQMHITDAVESRSMFAGYTVLSAEIVGTVTSPQAAWEEESPIAVASDAWMLTQAQKALFGI